MPSRPFRIASSGPPALDLFGGGRSGPREELRFTRSQMELIARTVRRTPEVMVKVTGGGTTLGKVSAHMRYISQKGKLAMYTDEGDVIHDRDRQALLLKDWHLELSSGQHRSSRSGDIPGRPRKLVHNIVLSMPSPTRPDKVLAAAKVFAREKFGVAHRYAMVLHTHQKHPHVHLVVRAEDAEGRHLHIHKAMLREWRQDFARLMREQGVPANATSRAWRGRGRAKKSDYRYRANRRGRSRVLASEVKDVIKELHATRTIHDPARHQLIESRKALIAGWMRVAEALDSQGAIELAGDVRYFVRHLPPRRTDKEELAIRYVDHLRSKDEKRAPPSPQRELELTR